MIEISIVIPVYNVENYLVHCLDSIVNQITSKVEILLINDGSTDNSRKICIEYEKMFEEIILIDKVNGGLSDARNHGIKNARGKYIVFVDSDDFLEDGYISILLECLKLHNGVDIIMHSYNEYIEDSNKYEIKSIFNNIDCGFYSLTQESKVDLFKKASHMWPAWKNVVKKTFIDSNNLYFKKDFLHEDVDWTTKLILNAQSLLYLDKSLYNYRINRKDSIMNTRGFKSIKDVAIIIRDLEKYMIESKLDDNIKNMVLDRLSRSFYTTLRFYNNCSKDEKIELKKLLKEYKSIFSYSILLKHRLFNIAIKFLGINNSITMYNYFI